MYNRYLNAAPCTQPQAVPEPAPEKERSEPAGLFGGLGSGLSQRLSNFRLDADTLIVLAVIWFVLADNLDDCDTELLIAIGVLLILGL